MDSIVSQETWEVEHQEEAMRNETLIPLLTGILYRWENKCALGHTTNRLNVKKWESDKVVVVTVNVGQMGICSGKLREI